MTVQTITVRYHEPEDTFYFASDDGETFYELTRLPDPGEGLPSRDGGTRPMGYTRRYFDHLAASGHAGVEHGQVTSR